MSQHVRKALLDQAKWCIKLGSPIMSEILIAIEAALDDSTATGRSALAWQGDPHTDALAMRLSGPFHALARRGLDPQLSAFYSGQGGDAGAIIARVLHEQDAFIAPWLERVPQTNEVGRAAMLWPGIMEITHRFGPDVELLELGASAGLNLNMDRFGYVLGGLASGDLDSPLQMTPVWKGAPPRHSPVNVIARAGVDRDPVDLSDPAEIERLTAYVWADQTLRLKRIGHALGIAAQFPCTLVRGDIVDWVRERLAMPQTEGVTRIFFHSITFMYLPKDAQDAVQAMLDEAGAKASTDKPLARLQMELVTEANAPELRLQCWPGSGEIEKLAEVHPHGLSINWVVQSG